MPTVLRRSIASLVLVLVFACTTARLATPTGETRLGAEAAAEVEQHLGLVRTPALETYVVAIGERLSRGAGVRGGLTYRFAVVDMPEPNAFALPGGYVYVSRGLLALLNSEDELASVIAHEIGHISARHHLRHSLLAAPLIPVRVAAGIGGLATGIVSPMLGQVVGALGSAPGAITLATHSRGQENEADEIGQKLVAEAGWDPRAIASVMDALTREDELGGRDPARSTFLDTHPTTPARAKRTLDRAAALPIARSAPIAPDRRHFYQRLDGLLYGRPATDGVVVDAEFLHPDLAVRVAFPAGWRIENGSDAVIAAPKEDDALALFSIAARGDDPAAVAKQVIRNASLALEGPLETTTIGGLAAARVTAKSRARGATFLNRVAWVAHGGYVYQVAGTSLEKDWPRYREPFEAFVASFRPLTPRDRERIRETRVRIVDAQPGETLAKLIARSGSAWSVERAAAANAVPSAEASLGSGDPVKVVRWETYRGDAE
jgi:predicted Zn-dependent protease